MSLPDPDSPDFSEALLYGCTLNKKSPSAFRRNIAVDSQDEVDTELTSNGVEIKGQDVQVDNGIR